MEGMRGKEVEYVAVIGVTWQEKGMKRLTTNSYQG
jgi:hypothetical protein